MPNSSLHSEVINLENLFVKEYNFPYAVPPMQRDVVWESKHVIDLWTDIEQHMNSTLMNEMFLGVLIMHSTPSLASLNPDEQGYNVKMPTLSEMINGIQGIGKPYLNQVGLRRWADVLEIPQFDQLGDEDLCKEIDKKRKPTRVIDGQQRITTLSIGAKILSEICKRKGLTDLSNRLEKICVTRAGDVRILHRDDKDKTDFKNIIENHSDKVELKTGWAIRSTDDPSIVKNIYCTTLDHIWKKVKNSKPRLAKISEWFLENIYVVYLDTTQESQEHLIFKAINDAGARLVTSQKFKSILFHKIAMNTKSNQDKHKQESLQTKWERIETIISLHRDPRKVTDFLRAYCRSIGCKSDGNKTLKNEDVLQRLIDVLESHTQKSKPLEQIEKFVTDIENSAINYFQLRYPSAEIKKIEDLKKPINQQDTWDAWPDILDLNNIYTSGGLIPLLMAVRKLKTTKEQAKCLKYILLITVFSVIPKKVKTKPSKVAGDYSTEWIDLLIHKKLKDFKLDVRKKILKDNEYIESANKYTEARDVTKDAGGSGAKAHAEGVKAQCRYIRERWIENMQNQVFSASDIGQIKFLLRKIEKLAAKGGAAWLTNYDTMEINAEHIFPKTTKWGPNSISNWRREFDEDNTLWPSDEGTRNNLKWMLGNFLLLESGLNKGCGNKTWKGWNATAKATTGKPHKSHTIKPTGKLGSRHGKIHWYKFQKWEHQGTEYEGSQLIAVENFISTHESEDYWSQSLLKTRTEKLVNDAMDGSKTQDFKLSLLFR